MKLEQATKDRIVRNVFLSLLIYALPLLLMAGTFYLTGERPWEKPNATEQQKINTIKLNNKNHE